MFFLQSRPHIDWIRQISAEGFSAAASGAVGHGCGETRSATASTLLSIAKLSAMLSSPSPVSSSSSSSSNFPSSSSASTAVRANTRSSSSSNSVRSVTRDNARSKHVYSSGSDAMREASANLAVLAAQRTVLEGDSRYGNTICFSTLPLSFLINSFNTTFSFSFDFSPLLSSPLPSFFFLHSSLSLLPSLRCLLFSSVVFFFLFRFIRPLSSFAFSLDTLCNPCFFASRT